MIIRIFRDKNNKSKSKIKKTGRQRGFSNLLHYHERNQSELIHTENILEGNADKMSQYFNKVASRSNRVKDPVFHAVVSFAYTEIAPSDEIISAIVRQYLQKLGYGNQPWVVYRHDDKKHIHFHIVSSRVNIQTGRRINNSFEDLRTWEILTDLAPLFGYRVGNGQSEQEIVKVQELNSEKETQAQMPEEMYELVETPSLDVNEMQETDMESENQIQQLETEHKLNETQDQDIPILAPDYTMKIMDESRNAGLVDQINRAVQEVIIKDQPYSMYRFIQGCKKRGLEVRKLPRGYVIQRGKEYPIGLSKLPIFTSRRLSYILKENKRFRNREKKYITRILYRALKSLPPLDLRTESAPDLFASKLRLLMLESGINVIYNTSKSGVSGVSFEHCGQIFKGSDLKQSWETIIKTMSSKYTHSDGGKVTSPARQSESRFKTLISGAAVGRRMSDDDEERRREEELYRE